MSKLSALAGSEGYGACDDEGIGERPTSKKPAVSAKAETSRFYACECSHALLAANSYQNECRRLWFVAGGGVL